MKPLFNLLFTITLFAFTNSCTSKQATSGVINSSAFENKIATLVNGQLIDVRTPEEFVEGHIENAKMINYKATGFEQEISKLDKNKPVFLYCRSGRRSARAYALFIELGFTEVYDLEGGFNKWKTDGKNISN